MLNAIKSILQNIIDQIDSGNCNMSDEEMLKTIDILRQYANPEEKKQRWFKELFWTNKDLASNC